MAIKKDPERAKFIETVQRFRLGLISRKFMAQQLNKQRKLNAHTYLDYFGYQSLYNNMLSSEPSGSLDITLNSSGKTGKTFVFGDDGDYQFPKELDHD